MKGGSENGLRPDPAEDSDEEEQERDGEDYLPRHVQPIPERTVRHFVALLVAHRFGERAAGADPAAISALAPAPDHRRDEHESLDERDDQPPGQRRIGE